MTPREIPETLRNHSGTAPPRARAGARRSGVGEQGSGVGEGIREVSNSPSTPPKRNAPCEPSTVDGWTLDLPYSSPPLSLNRRLHWAVEQRIRKQLIHDVTWLARARRVPTGLERIIVTLHWRPGVVRRRDTDNPAPTIKAAIDALVTLGVVVDDDSAHVWSGCVVHPVGKPARLWLTITELVERPTPPVPVVGGTS